MEPIICYGVYIKELISRPWFNVILSLFTSNYLFFYLQSKLGELKEQEVYFFF